MRARWKTRKAEAGVEQCQPQLARKQREGRSPPQHLFERAVDQGQQR